ncbi:MAG: uroporphyrinogen-III C-methyltransferase [Acidobacteriota bacterium]
MNDIKKKPGKIYLIGAGPGDPQLLTLKAKQVLEVSDLILYDALVNPQILMHASNKAEIRYVGKRAGELSLTQAEINTIMIESAQSGLMVARLKGGDPFIFGRGGEEAEALVDAGLDWEIIPGISAGIAVAAYAGIPLTHRNFASSVAFITGNDGHKQRQKVDWSTAAHLADTLVIFMCAKTIAKIAAEIIANGRPASTPIAIIRWGTYEHQEVYFGTLAEIAASEQYIDHDSAVEITSPAIAIVGDVVQLREKLHWFGYRELQQPFSSLIEETILETVGN